MLLSFQRDLYQPIHVNLNLMMHGVSWYSIDSKSCFQEKSVSAGVLGSGMNHPAR